MATITTQERTNILKLVAGMFNAAPGANYLNEFTTAYQALGNNFAGLATALGNTGAFKSLYPSTLTATEFATKFLTTLGLQANTEAAAWVQAKVNSGASFSSVILQAVSALDATSDAQFAAAKNLLANKAAVAEYYSVPAPVGVGVSSENLATLQNVFSKVTDNVASVQIAKDAILSGGNGQSNTLTTGQDVVNGTAGNDIIRGVAGQQVGAQDQSTFNSSDIIDGGAGDDKLVINMTGPRYDGGATVKNIETLQIGTNQGAATFDYNVNQGAYEINGVNTVIFDQITANEVLTVNNITPTSTTNAIPVLSWENEAGSAAGTAAVTFRQAAVDKDTEVTLNLSNVRGGTFNLGTGANASVETLRIGSNGSSTNTLVTSGNTDTTAVAGGVDLVGASADGINDNGALKTVIVTGAQTFGKVAEVVTDSTNANYGLTNRSSRGVDDGGLDTTSTASNLTSVAATVTTVNATDATGDVNIRFTPRVDGAEVAVTFKGGAGNDYVEFQQGNVNATGGAGNDTFAFVNTQVNSTITTADTISGGAGVDTIQLGVNGQGTYSLETTEFNNKTGIDVLDLRGQTNTVKLSDAFVTSSDAGLTVRTDKIVQTNATTTANPTTGGVNNVREDASVNTIDLTALAANRAVTVIGGSGSDRLLVNEVALNSSIVFDGGTNVANTAGTAATAGDYDTLTVVNSAVLSRGDLSNIKGIEGIVLADTVTGASTYTIELTEAFILNNTGSANVGSTSIDDRILQIVTANAANGQSLTSADTVTIDVTDLFDSTNNTLKTSLVGRQIDTNGIGATVTYTYKGTSYGSIAAVQAATNAAGGTFLSGNDSARNDVANSAAAVTAAAVVTPTALAANTSYTGTANADAYTSTIAVLANATVNGGNGTDTLTVTDVGAVALTADFTNIEVLNLANGANTVTFAAGGAFTNVNGGTGADTVTTNNMVAGGAIALGAGNDSVTLSAALANTTLNGGDGVDTLSVAATVNISSNSISGFEVVSFAGAATLSVEQSASFASVASVTATAGQAITFSNGGAASAVGNANTYVFSNTATSLSLGATAATVTGGNGNDTVVGSAGNDSLVGGAGNDSLTGGSGVDTISGGTGNDTIVLTEATASNDIVQVSNYGAANVDTVIGFSVNNDKIQISAGNITLSGGTTYTLSGGNGTDVTANDSLSMVTVVAGAGAAAADASAALTFVKATTAAASFAASLGTSTVTVTNQTAGEAVAFVYYDTAAGQAVVGLVDATSDGTAGTISQSDTFVELVRVGMTTSDFALLNAGSFAPAF